MQASKNDRERTKDELLGQVRALRARIAELEQNGPAREQIKESWKDPDKASRAWLEHSPICTKVVDPDHNLLFMSRAGVNALGIDDITPFYGKPYPFDFYPEPFRTEMSANLKRAERTGEILTQESSVVDLAGRELWFHSTIVPVHFSDGKTEYTIVVSIDTTESNKSNAALRESERSYRSLGESIQDGITRYDRRFRALYQNAAGYRLSGLTEAQFLGRTYRDLGFDEHLCDFSERHIQVVFDTGKPTDATFEWNGADGPRTYNWRLYPEFDQAQEVQSVLCISCDITDRKREEEKKQVERQLQQRQKLESLGVMAGGIAHDFNNILSVILGNADIALQDRSSSATSRDSILEIRTAAERASGLTDQMLAYSGSGALAFEAMDLSSMVLEMARLLEVSHTKKAIVRYQFENSLPGIEGDVSQLRQVVMNLVTNASEALGDDGGVITIATGLTDATKADLASTYTDDQLPKGRYVYLQVTDTGFGMSEEALGRIFEPFFTTKFTGRGLGMAAVLGIVRSHKGAIDIQSEVGEGTRVKVMFPALSKPERPRAIQPRRIERWSGSGTVLVVDDEPQIRTLMARVLEEKGYTVLTAEDGRVATDLFAQHSDEIVCVVLDLTMPRMGGEETFLTLKNIRADIPVLLLSGYSEEQLEKRVEGLDFAGFLKKPASCEALLERVRAVSKRRG